MMIKSNTGEYYSNMKYKIIISILLIFLISINLHADSLNDGNNAYNDKDYAEALSAYEKAIKENPSNPYTYANMGNTLFNLNDYDKAITNFNKAIENIDNKDKSNDHLLSEIYYNLSTAYYYNNKHKEALQSIETSLLRNPDNKDAKYNWYVIKKALSNSQGKQSSTSNNDSQEGEENKNNPQNNENQNNNSDDSQEDGNENQNNEINNNNDQNNNQQNKSTSKEDRDNFLNEMSNQELMNRKNSSKKSDNQELGTIKIHLDKDW